LGVGGESLGGQVALNDMAAALLDACLVLLLAIVTLKDLRTRLIPDGPLIFALAAAVAILAVDDPAALPLRMLAGGGAGGFLLGASLIRPDGMGLGDVKLAGVLGVYLGTAVVATLLVAFASGSLAGLVLIARHGWEGRFRTIPFAPFLALGALVVIAPQP
jgi:leader peptidase (prepilin peptidase) / N-methyltransferase